jgi:hypothetical protein
MTSSLDCSRRAPHGLIFADPHPPWGTRPLSCSYPAERLRPISIYGNATNMSIWINVPIAAGSLIPVLTSVIVCVPEATFAWKSP